MEKKNPSIKCDVESCKYNDCDCHYCTLDEIKVSCTCDNEDAEEKDETICASFECDCHKEKKEED